MNGPLLASTAFVASAVESVEALTIVLAVGVTRSWRSSLSGAGMGLLTLVAIVLLLGPAIVAHVPFAALELVIGLFLLLFGSAWLRKAVLRYGGRKALHDEAAIYARTVGALAAVPDGAGIDRLGFATAFNAVLLEGLEVALIVLTLGASSSAALRWAGLGAVAAAIVVAAAGVALRAPAARVPENALKFIVGIMLMSVGTLWSGEGLGIAWWRGDLSLPIIVAVYVAVSSALVALVRRTSASLRQAA